MTATTTPTTTIGTRQAEAPRSHVRRLALSVGSLLATIGGRWNDLVDAGQLGPNAETSVGRHTGARI